jgi:hypothetical protein
MPYTIHDLTGLAVDWARREVGHYSGGLRDQLLARDWTGVRLFAWLPADLPNELQEPLDASFVVRLGREHVMDWDYVAAETGYIQAHLLATDRGVFLYQTDYSRLKNGHPIPRAPGEKLVSFDRGLDSPQDYREEVWVYLDRGFEESESIKLAYHRGIWPQHGLGVLTSLPPDSHDLGASEVTCSGILRQLGARTRSILIPGWRGSAFIFVEFPI